MVSRWQLLNRILREIRAGSLRLMKMSLGLVGQQKAVRLWGLRLIRGGEGTLWSMIGVYGEYQARVEREGSA